MGKKTDMMLCDNIMSVLPMVTQIDRQECSGQYDFGH